MHSKHFQNLTIIGEKLSLSYSRTCAIHKTKAKLYIYIYIYIYIKCYLLINQLLLQNQLYNGEVNILEINAIFINFGLV